MVKKRAFVHVYDKATLPVDTVTHIDVEEAFPSEASEVAKKKENGVAVLTNHKKVLVDEPYVHPVEAPLNHDCDCAYNGDTKKSTLRHNTPANNGTIEPAEVLVDLVDKAEEVVVEQPKQSERERFAKQTANRPMGPPPIGTTGKKSTRILPVKQYYPSR